MPTDRLFRHSISGIMFMLSLIFFFLFFGGEPNELLILISDKSLVAFIGLFISTPAIGLIVSTIVFHVHYLNRKKIFYFVPDDPELVEYVFKEFPELENMMPETRVASKWTNDEIDRFYPYYQIQVRKFITGLTMEYLERRWSVYWTNTNTIAAIIGGFLVMLTMAFFSNDTLVLQLKSPYKWIGVITLIGYCIAAQKSKLVAKEQGKTFEHLALKKGIQAEKGKELKGIVNPQTPPT